MAEQKQDAVRIEWRQSVSWAALFRGFRIALDVKKMFLGFVAVVATLGAFMLLTQVWKWLSATPVPEERAARIVESAILTAKNLPKAIIVVSAQRALSQHASGLVTDLLTTFNEYPGFCVVFALVTLLIWSYFGAPIARIAALQFSRDERISFTEALNFTGKKFLSLFSAPLIPLLAILFVCVFTGIVGLLVRIPGFGEWFGAVLWVLPLIVGFILALIALGALFGLPLMHPTIGVEGSDAFDAISRSFSYVYSRPWRAAFYAVLALIYGVIVFVFVSLFADLALGMSKVCVAFVSSIFGAGVRGKVDAMWPTITTLNWTLWADPRPGFAGLSGSEQAASYVLRLWVWLVYGLVWGFAVSYLYSALTIIYFLLRKNVDHTEFDEVYMEEEEEEEFEEPAETKAAGETPAGPAAEPGSGTAAEPPKPSEEAGGESAAKPSGG